MLLKELQIPTETPMRLYCDNKAIINIVHNPVHHHDCSKHVEVYRHFIKEKLEEGIVYMPYIPIEKQLTNILTKGLKKSFNEDLTSKLRMIDIFEPT